MKTRKLLLCLFVSFLALAFSSCDSSSGGSGGSASLTPSVSIDQVSFDNGASSQIVTINLGRYKYFGAFVDELVDWCDVEILRAQGKVRITTTPNTGSIARECHVKIWVSNTDDPDDEDGDWFTVLVQQSATGGGGGGGGTTEKWVDLGLPSGNLWASYNIGGNRPEDYGDYFSWGATDTKTAFTWSTYEHAEWGVDIYGREGYYLIKYCSRQSDGLEGFTDNLTELQQADDAARVNWGSGARIPTKEEWQELKDHTTHDYAEINGICGRRFTGSNGKSIFIPFAGYINNESMNDDSFYGYYWSKALYTNAPNYAWVFVCGEGGCNIASQQMRILGASVRAVRSGK